VHVRNCRVPATHHCLLCSNCSIIGIVNAVRVQHSSLFKSQVEFEGRSHRCVLETPLLE
jgi:hypothetical protein